MGMTICDPPSFSNLVHIMDTPFPAKVLDETIFALDKKEELIDRALYTEFYYVFTADIQAVICARFKPCVANGTRLMIVLHVHIGQSHHYRLHCLC